MPITDSAKKALRQSDRRHADNLIKKEAFKAAVKKLKKLLIAKDVAGAKATLSLVYQTLDKAAKTNVIHKKTASRLKSRLTAQLAKQAK